jgi:hypothetical protein
MAAAPPMSARVPPDPLDRETADADPEAAGTTRPVTAPGSLAGRLGRRPGDPTAPGAEDVRGVDDIPDPNRADGSLPLWADGREDPVPRACWSWRAYSLPVGVLGST